MRIFISSTVYDLVDLRSELNQLFNNLGVSVLLSDIAISDFSVVFDQSSIETCLTNVASCDYVIIILDKRYGPKLNNFGYGEISATHLEYREARRLKKPIIMLVRDKTYSEYCVYKKNKGKVTGIYINQENTGLFELIKEHTTLTKKDIGNWFFTFVDSIDAKEIVKKQLHIPILKESIPKNIANGIIPILTIKTSVDRPSERIPNRFVVRSLIQNLSKSGCFLEMLCWEGEKEDRSNNMILSPGNDITMTLIMENQLSHANVDKNMIVEYKTYDGILIKEKHQLHVSTSTNGSTTDILQGIKLLDRKFYISEKVNINLENLS